MRRSPGFTLAAVAVLSLAIGANTAIFSVMEGVLLRELPYRDSQQLVVLWKSIPKRNIEWDWTSAPTIRDWRDQATLVQEMAMVLRPEGSKVTLGARADSPSEDGPIRIQASIVSGNFFDVLGSRAEVGRTFSLDEATHAENVAVISHGFWRRRLGGSAQAINQKLIIDGHSVQVIGVMPRTFEYPDKQAEIWLLLESDPRWARFQMPRFRIADAFSAIARLKPGITPSQAQSEMNAVAGRLAVQHPATDLGLGIRVQPLAGQIAGPRIRAALGLLGAAALCVLLIAFSNLASLLVARGTARGRELAVRAALGASRTRLMSLVAAESVLITIAGGAGGIALAYAALPALLALAPPDLPRTEGIAINAQVLVFSLVLCVTAVLFFGIAPAVRLAGLGGGSLHVRGMAASPKVTRVRGVLVAAQYAMALVLLVAAGLLIRSLILLNAVDRGFDTGRLISVRISLPHAKYGERARGMQFVDNALGRLKALPGVEGAAMGTAVFNSFSGNAPNENIIVEGRPFAPDVTLHSRIVADADYFRLLRIPLLAGRTLSDADTAGRPDVAVINEAMAHRFWPGENAVGKRFKEVVPGTDEPWTTVVGVIASAVYSRDGLAIPVFYPSGRQWYFTEIELTVKSMGDPRTVLSAARTALREADPTLADFDVTAVNDRLAAEDRPRLFQLELTGMFSGLALLLAATGLYGLMSYSVARRTNEFGIRVALGATRHSIAAMMLRQGLAIGAAGSAIGVAGAFAFGRVLSASLPGVNPSDPVVFGAVAIVLAIVMLAACTVPALRASRVDPLTALRHE